MWTQIEYKMSLENQTVGLFQYNGGTISTVQIGSNLA